MIFDGTNHLIVLEAADGNTVSAIGLYSRWKDWVHSNDGAPFIEAFSTIGGDELGGGQFAWSYFFLNTAAGWQIRPREASHTVVVDGNLFPIVAGAEMFASTLGSWLIRVMLRVSSMTQTVATPGAAAEIAETVWTRRVAGIAAEEMLIRATPTIATTVISDEANTRTSFKTDLTESVDDYWKDALLSFSIGATIAGQVKKIIGYNGSTKFVTVSGSGFTGTPQAGDVFVVVNR